MNEYPECCVIFKISMNEMKADAGRWSDLMDGAELKT